MYTPLRKILATVLLTAAGLLAAHRAAADAPKPALTIAFAGYDQLNSDATAIDKLNPHLGLSSKLESMLALATKGKNLAGLDKSRPWSVVVAVGDSGDPIVEGYLPITDLKKFMEGMPSPSGEAYTPNSDGVYEIPANGKTVYVKQKDKWAILSDSTDTLVSAPADPPEEISELAKKYLIAARGNVQNIPADRRDQFLAAFRGLVEFFLASQPGNEEQQALQRASAKQMFDSLDKLSKQLDTLTIGLGMDAATKSIYFDVETRAVADSELATKFAAMGDAKTNFAGFALPGAAWTMLATSSTDDDQAAQAKEMLDNLKTSAEKYLDDNEALGDKREVAKRLLKDGFDVVQQTVALKKTEMGMAVVLEDAPAVVGGMTIAGGKKLDATLKELVKQVSADKPELASLIKFDAEEYEGVKFHVATLPVSDHEAQNVFGETVQIVLGLSESRLYIGAGKNPIELLKKAIAASKESPDKSIPPMEMVLSAEPIAKFFAKVIPDRSPSDAQSKKQAGKLAAQLAKTPGADHVTMTVKPIPKGALMRLSVDPGVTKTLVELIAQAQHTAAGDSSDEN